MAFKHDLLARGDLMVVVQELYDSEINSRVSCFWDAGWTVALGDEMNGFVSEENFENWQLHNAGRWLAEQAIHHYPDSRFALVYEAALATASAPG